MNECERVIEMIKELSLGVNGFNESEIADMPLSHWKKIPPEIGHDRKNCHL